MPIWTNKSPLAFGRELTIPRRLSETTLTASPSLSFLASGFLDGEAFGCEICAFDAVLSSLVRSLVRSSSRRRLTSPPSVFLLIIRIYYAPGVVCEALKTAVYAQCLLELVGVNPVPRYTADHNDIVTCFDSGSAAALQGFCAGIQSCSPVDSFVSPEPADEPGYTDQVIMASGSFTEGSTIEISCDGPLRAPYTCYLQGGVNFTAGRAAVLNAVQKAFFA